MPFPSPNFMKQEHGMMAKMLELLPVERQSAGVE